MSEVNPDVLACMHAIHKATNDGTFDKDAINEALRKLHDFLTGAAYEAADPSADPTEEPEAVEVGGEGEEQPHARKPRRKR